MIALDEWRRHGAMVPACLLGMSIVAAHAYALGVMFAPLEAEYGWSRAQISAGPLATSIGTLLLAPFGGRAVDHFGPRRIALVGVPMFAACLALIGTAESNLAWIALHVLLAGALILIYPTVWTAAIAERFTANRGLAMAIALSGTGITAAVVPVIVSRLLEAYGWRGAYAGLGALSFVVVYPAVVFLFARGTTQAGRERAAPAAQRERPPEMRSGKFIRLAGAGLIYSICVTMLGINAVPVLMADGFDVLVAAEIAGLLGVGTIIGRLAGGLLLDRIDGRWVAIGSGMGALGAALILLFVTQSPFAASLACFSLGLAAGAEFDACAYLTTRHFDRRNFGALFGTIGGLSGFGSGVAPFIGSAIYDASGGYDLVLLTMLPLLVIASALFWSLGRYPDAPDIAPN
ncbi:MFS transporter [Stakelama tenebrarum]|uniref:MFS transporter n=1 Tax=Stakelama tenebrarum TaxID=2711215 RepID=A0A6G6Y293_9SPHN|nr:MFS transporter [Sphingosinithalassobacter tenebrarum]QIG78838.1 MFS transporter [Sphingosinithalassobacter tenebrarum]